MGSQLSSRRPQEASPVHPVDGAGIGGGNVPTPAARPSGVHFTSELNSYSAACRRDPELQTFDTTLQERTSRVLSTLALGVEVRSLSFDSLKEITGCLLEMNQEVVMAILECKKDIWKNAELFDLVEDYFENSLQTLDFCTVLEKCLKRARDVQLIIHVALQCFTEEETKEVDCRSKRYQRTLEELRLFKDAGHPFSEEFFQVFQSVYKQQLLMLEKLHLRKKKLDKKLKSIKAWRKVSSIIFAATCTALIICSVVAAVIAAPPVAAALAAATSIPIGSMGKWIDSLLKDYQDALKGHKEVLSSMQVGTYITIKDLDSIQVLIDKLEVQITTFLDNAEFAIRDEKAVKFAIEEIRKKLELLMKSIEDLDEQADRCSRDIKRARTVVLQRIIRPPKEHT